MVNRRIGGDQFAHMLRCAFARLQSQVDIVNSLNVFPVPDGDTGSNMLKTMQSGLTYVHQFEQQEKDKNLLAIGQVAQQFAKGLLLGARGNSGVILSQLFNGISKVLSEYVEVDVKQFASALLKGVETAYEAVVTPVEGTILTVAKRAAEMGNDQASKTDNWKVWFESVYEAATRALEQTPELLPILKEAGVVDSGGQGLVYIYEGFVDALKHKDLAENRSDSFDPIDEQPLPNDAQQVAQNESPQMHFAADDIVHFYDLEFFIRLQSVDGNEHDQHLEPVVEQLTNRLTEIGDSVIVIPEGNAVKIHVHSNQPGHVLNIALEFGELVDIHIQNMREQFRMLQPPSLPQKATLQSCFVAITPGPGIDKLFQSLGNCVTISGGDTMNTSAEEIIRACKETGAEHVFLLPNNANILLAAKQAAKLSEQNIHVILTRTIAQGLAAAVSFDANASVDENVANMIAAIENVKSGHVTFAVRDAQINDLQLHENDYIGINENKIVAASSDLLNVCMQLLEKMIDEDDELLTVIVGKFADHVVTEQLKAYLAERYPTLEIEFHHGGQRLQFYIFAIE